MLTPSASSRSAEPHLLVLERLPCLATAQPAPAATSAAVVETLKVEGPPPVPAVSTRSSRLGRDRRRQRAHRPRQADQLRHRLPLRPQGDQEGAGLDLVGAPLHDLGEHRRGVVGGQVVAGADRVDRPADDVVGHRLSSPRKFVEQVLALRGQHRLGVELDALGRQLAVAGAHHHVAEAWRSARARRAGRGRRPASGSGRRPAGSAGRRRSSCRRARPRRPCRGSARPGRPGRRRPRPSPGGRGRRRAPASPPRRRRGSPRPRSRPRPACRGPGETTSRSAPRSSSSPTSALSLRTTSTSAPSSPRYWTRL